MVGTGLFYRVRRDFARGGRAAGRPPPQAAGKRAAPASAAPPKATGFARGARLRRAGCARLSPPPHARQVPQAPSFLPLPLRKPDKPGKPPASSLSPSASPASPRKPGRGPAGPQAARRRRRRASGLRSLRRLRRRACGPPCPLHRPLISTNQPRRAIMIYYPKGGALPCRITFIRRFTPPSAASQRGGSPPTARSPCWRAVRGLPASWAGRCTAIPPPASSPATVWCSGMAALHPALPLAGRGRSGRCWRPRASPFCRTAGWTCPAAGGKMRKKRCKGRIFL